MVPAPRWVCAVALCALLLRQGGAAAAAAAPAAPANGCTLALAAGQHQSFARCALIDHVGNSFHLLWSAEAAGDPTKLLLTIAMNATSSGYVSVGFPSRPGLMADATAMILQACAVGEAGCAGGAKLVQWYMSGLKQSDVKPDNRLPVTNVQAGIPAAGQLAGSFQIEVPAPSADAGSSQLLLDAAGSVELIFAAGRLMSDGTPRQHFADGHAALPLLAISPDAGAATTNTASSAEGGTIESVGDAAAGGAVDALVQSSEEDNSLKAAHAWLGVVGWGVLVPVGIVVARSFKDTLPPTWFHLHRLLLAIGFILGTVSLGTGFGLRGGWETNTTDQTIHRNLGMACTILGAAQFSAIVIRPTKHHKRRWAWELCHQWVGRTAAAIAIANIYWGCLHMWDLGVWAWASYTGVLAAIVVTSLAKDGSDWLRTRRHATNKMAQAVGAADVELASDDSNEKLSSE